MSDASGLCEVRRRLNCNAGGAGGLPGRSRMSADRCESPGGLASRPAESPHFGTALLRRGRCSGRRGQVIWPSLSTEWGKVWVNIPLRVVPCGRRTCACARAANGRAVESGIVMSSPIASATPGNLASRLLSESAQKLASRPRSHTLRDTT